MGACYYVEGRLRFADGGKAFCESANNKIDEIRCAGWATFDFALGNRNEPFGLFNILTGGTAEERNGYWTAGFDARYGWEEVLVEVFEEAMKETGNRSWVKIWPDEGMHHYFKRGGKVEYRYR